MQLNNYYWFFESALSKKFCDEVIRYGKMQQNVIGRVGEGPPPVNKKELKALKKTRDSSVAWLNETWIYRQITPFVHEANKLANWNFQIDFSEHCQFTKYTVDQHYSWHCDAQAEPFNKPGFPDEHGKIRKLSVTVSLSDPSDYTGGELEFNFNRPLVSKKQNLQKCIEIIPRGSLVVFPSFVYHRVCPVKQGTRYSLVNWNLGHPYN